MLLTLREICENYLSNLGIKVMYIPEYTITPNILKSVSSIEYNRSVIENTNILPNFEDRLLNETSQEFIVNSYKFLGENINPEEIKKHTDQHSRPKNPKISNLLDALSQIESLSLTQELEEKDIKSLHKVVAKDLVPNRRLGKYRSRKMPRKTDPEEILAEISELIDWFNTVDAMETSPVLVSGIVKGQLEITYPFDYLSSVVANLCSKVVLYSHGYQTLRYTSIETYYNSSKRNYEQSLLSILEEEGDFTAWLEYYTTGMSTQTATAVEKVKLYAKDTKLAKVSGRIYLTNRQEEIVEYLQDFGIMQNKDFSRLFPRLSEDSVLRDLKKLITAGIVVKRGSTKSSRYELG